MAKNKSNAGRPLIFETPEELEKAIKRYLNGGARTKTFIVGKGDNQKEIELPVISITGLALFLGFESRQSFYDYEKRPKFSYTIKRARLYIEREYEESLQYGNTTGAIFALKNMGWIDRQDITTNNESLNKDKTIQLKINNKDIELK